MSLTKVNFDIESQDFDEEKVIKETLRSAIRNGRVGSFFVESEGFTFRPVTGKFVFCFAFFMKRFLTVQFSCSWLIF